MGAFVRSSAFGLIVAAACTWAGAALGQPPSLGPTQATAAAGAAAWPTKPPTRIYVVPFTMEPGLKEQLEAQANSSVIPQGPVRKLIASRPRVADIVTGNDRSQPVGNTIAKLVADELAQAGWPAVFWDKGAPPADGWWLVGQVVSLDEGSAVARNAVGFGVGNKSIGIDIAMSDPATAGGTPFFIVDSSDKGRRMPGTVAIGAVAGFNPYVVVGKLVASNSGISDITQQRRIADEIAGAVAEAINEHPPAPVR